MKNLQLTLTKDVLKKDHRSDITKNNPCKSVQSVVKITMLKKIKISSERKLSTIQNLSGEGL